MNPNLACRWVVPIVALAFVTGGVFGQEPLKGKGGEEKPAAKPDSAAIGKLVEQLKSTNFKTRERAAQELSKLEEVPEALLHAVKSGDLETKRRAEAILAVITDRVEEKAFQALVADLHKVEVDRFVRRMVSDEKFAGNKEWKVIEALAKAVTKKANDLGGRKYEVPAIDMNSLPLANLAIDRFDLRNKRLLLRETDPRSTEIRDCVVLCTGSMPRLNGLTNSIVIVDGDFSGATEMTKCLLIVRGNVGRFNGIIKSMIIATGNLEGATACEDSFLQVNNHQIRFTVSKDSVLIRTAVKTTGRTNSRVLETDKGPLQLLKFSARKPDDQLPWGKEVNGLAVAITPADQKDKFLIRWKNVGKDVLEVPWVRLNSDFIDSNRDHLLDHVLLKGPDGKMVRARKYPPFRAGGPPPLNRSVILAPGKAFEEVIDLWRYVERPAADGRFKLSIEPELNGGRIRLEPDARAWTGQIASNVLELKLEK